MSLFGKKDEEPKGKLDDYSDSDYFASDEDAHRSVKYKLPSQGKQFATIYATQMKLISKSKMIIMLLILVIIIPVLVYAGLVDDMLGSNASYFGPGDYAAVLLGGLSIMIALLPSVLMSKTLPSEFRERTAYLSMALPQSRVTFYLGKYLASLTVCVATFILAYAITIFMSISAKGSMDAGVVIESLGFTLAGIFAVASTAYGISAFLKKGSSILTFFIFFVIIPVLMILMFTNNILSADYLSYFPSFAGDAACTALGISSFPVSINGMFAVLFNVSFDASLAFNGVLYVIWGILFLLLGLFKFMRREM